MASVAWLLVITHMQVYSEKSKLGAGENKCKIYIMKRKITPENLMSESRLVLKEMRKLKKDLIQSELKGAGHSGRDPMS